MLPLPALPLLRRLIPLGETPDCGCCETVTTDEGAIGAIGGEGKTSLLLVTVVTAPAATTASLSTLETVVDWVEALGVEMSVR